VLDFIEAACGQHARVATSLESFMTSKKKRRLREIRRGWKASTTTGGAFPLSRNTSSTGVSVQPRHADSWLAASTSPCPVMPPWRSTSSRRPAHMRLYWCSSTAARRRSDKADSSFVTEPFVAAGAMVGHSAGGHLAAMQLACA